MGDRVGLHPLSIIIAVMVGTTLLGGLLGGILAIPLTAALRVVMFRYVWKKREPRCGKREMRGLWPLFNVSSGMVAADVRRWISARKTLPPRHRGGYRSCDDS